ncbi:unnamed protein product [Calicophoron daubneyi]|uniref:Uncharacterized protein n=1 Tax=Calicophoron daubneyi TaxID=300641 RepID=A0AAV2TWH8_CALDB
MSIDLTPLYHVIRGQDMDYVMHSLGLNVIYGRTCCLTLLDLLYPVFIRVTRMYRVIRAEELHPTLVPSTSANSYLVLPLHPEVHEGLQASPNICASPSLSCETNERKCSMRALGMTNNPTHTSRRFSGQTSANTRTLGAEIERIGLTDYRQATVQLAYAYRNIIENYKEIEVAALSYRLSAEFGVKDRPNGVGECKVTTKVSARTSDNSSTTVLCPTGQTLHHPDNQLDSSTEIQVYSLRSDLVGPRHSLLDRYNGRTAREVLVLHQQNSRDHIRLSEKVFLGGVPVYGRTVTDTTCDNLQRGLSVFGPVTISWPKGTIVQSQNEQKHFDDEPKSEVKRGHCYAIFRDSTSVELLLSACQRRNKGCYLNLSSLCPGLKASHLDSIQVIPWDLNDIEQQSSDMKPDNLSKMTAKRVENHGIGARCGRKRQYYVFVGALHGMITARALFTMCADLFGNVKSVVLDTDAYHYPIGSGRVAFSSLQSFLAAVDTNFLHVESQFFRKTIQIDPYLEDALCSKCVSAPGVYFCRDLRCFDYFCPACWLQSHPWNTKHKPIRRTINQRQLRNLISSQL